jgi:hypothetical protein
MIVKQNERQTVHRFENGFGASVITDGYGDLNAPYEIGVIKFSGDKWLITYETPITDGVLGWQTQGDVTRVLSEIESWEPTGRASA